MKTIDLTKGPIAKGITAFAMPIFFGQLLQQFYNVADAWVVGNFADNSAFAAVCSAESLVFLVIGFFQGMSIGGGVVISRYFGAKDELYVERSIHTNILFGLLASVAATALSLLATPSILVWMKTPADVMPHSLLYFRIYFAGVSTVIMYNICMAIMRALGDSLHPLYYLIFSSLLNVALDLILVGGFHLGVVGAASATVFSQGLSVILCVIRMSRAKDYTRLDFRKLKFYRQLMKEVLLQGLPAGVQNSVISIGNLVVQKNINSFGAYAMAGAGAFYKIQGFVFMPITALSMALPTFVSQNLGAGQPKRAKKGSVFGIAAGVIIAEVMGVMFFLWSEYPLRLFASSPQAIAYGVTQSKVTTLFFFLLAFSHCAAGVLRGCGKSVVPMVTMLVIWCGIRITYVTLALMVVNEFWVLMICYPLTWALSTVIFSWFMLRKNIFVS